jgi:hypothetical protein
LGQALLFMVNIESGGVSTKKLDEILDGNYLNNFSQKKD